MDAWSKRRNKWFVSGSRDRIGFGRCVAHRPPYAQAIDLPKGKTWKSWFVNQNSWQTFQSHDISQTWLSSSRPIGSSGRTRKLHGGGEGRGGSISNEPIHNLQNKWNDTLRTPHRACTILSRYCSLSVSLLYWAVPFYPRRGACVMNRLILFTNFPYCANRRIV